MQLFLSIFGDSVRGGFDVCCCSIFLAHTWPKENTNILSKILMMGRGTTGREEKEAGQVHGMPGWNEVTVFSDFAYHATPGSPASDEYIKLGLSILNYSKTNQKALGVRRPPSRQVIFPCNNIVLYLIWLIICIATKIESIDLCVISDLLWKFHQNPLVTFSLLCC